MPLGFRSKTPPPDPAAPALPVISQTPPHSIAWEELPNKIPACWADDPNKLNGCQRKGTGKLGLCPDHEKALLDA